MLEKLNTSPDRERGRALRLGRAGPGGPRPSADLYRPGDLPGRDDPHLRRGLGLSRPREPDPEERRLHHRAARAAADHPAARLATARSARCSTAAPIAAPRCAARTRARRASSPAPITAGAILNTGKLRAVPWPDGYACDFKDAKFNVAQVPRVDSYRGFIFAHAQSRCAAADRLSRRHHQADRRMARPPAQRQDRGLRGQPAQVQGQLEARLRQFRRRLSRRVLAPLAAGDGEPPGRRRQQGHVLLQGLARHSRRCTWPIWATAITSRTSGRTSRSAPAACGRWKARRRARSITRRSCAAASAPRPRKSSTSPPPSRSTSTCFRTSRSSATTSRCSSRSRSMRPTSPGTAPRWSTRTACSAARSTRSTRCACARRSSSRISARSTISPISRRSSAGSPAWRTSGSTCIAASAFPAA